MHLLECHQDWFFAEDQAEDDEGLGWGNTAAVAWFTGEAVEANHALHKQVFRSHTLHNKAALLHHLDGSTTLESREPGLLQVLQWSWRHTMHELYANQQEDLASEIILTLPDIQSLADVPQQPRLWTEADILTALNKPGNKPITVRGYGNINKPVRIHVTRITRAARDLITMKGGSVNSDAEVYGKRRAADRPEQYAREVNAKRAKKTEKPKALAQDYGIKFFTPAQRE